MIRIFSLTTTLVLILIGVLALIRSPDRWPNPEAPPRQGEALAVDSVSSATPTHAPHALKRLVREPQNTWSNIAFMLGGAVLLFRSKTRTARTVGIALLSVGIGSFLYHASASRTLRHLDVAGMYCLYVAAIGLSVSAVSKKFLERAERHWGVFLALSFTAGVALAVSRNVVLFETKPFSLGIATAATATIMIIALCAVGVRLRTRAILIQIIAGIGLFAIAVICQVGDRPGNWLCNPESVVQAHALWHIFSATAFVLAAKTLDQGGLSQRPDVS